MRLPVWKRKTMVAEVVAETLDVARQSSRQDTFLRLIDQFEPALRRLAAAYLDGGRDCEDLFQEIALALWQAIPRFRGEASALGFIALRTMSRFHPQLRCIDGEEQKHKFLRSSNIPRLLLMQNRSCYAKRSGKHSSSRFEVCLQQTGRLLCCISRD